MESAIPQGTWSTILLTALAGVIAFDVFLRAINARRIFSSRNRPPKVETVNEQLRLGPESVFRIQGLPVTHEDRHVDAGEAEQMIRKALDVDVKIEVDVRSLAQLSSSPSQTATVTFSEIPSALDLRLRKQSDPIYTFRSSTATVRLTVDTHFNGFTPLQSPSDENYSLDVIALPGLGGHPFWSFKAKENDFMWLRDGLRESLPAARVLIYGYDTRLQRSNAFQSLQDLGLSFGHALASQIRAEKRASQALRPIVLIGQSLGGLVVKEALCKLSDGRDEEADILKSIEAIFFFGTPNSGMDISSLIPIVSGQPNEQFLRSVEKESTDLRRLGKKWHEITQHEVGKHVSTTLRIFSFYETVRSPTAAQNSRGEWKMTGPPTVLVERSSATHGRPWETGDNSFVIPVDRSHSDMAKFKSASDGLYRDFVVSWLEDILQINQSSHIDGRLSQEEEELLSKCQASLYFPDQETHRHQITDAKNNTCEWILKDKTYTDWVNSSSEPFLWIEGHAGAGKSTILKHALRRYESNPPHQAIVASYFFYGRGTKLQKTPQGLYQKLLYQLLPHFPRTFWGLISRCEEQNKSQPRNSWTWSLEELRASIYRQLPQACQQRPVTIFIDALDECSGTNPEQSRVDSDDGFGAYQGELIRFIRTLSCLDTTGRLKLCVSCRYYPNLFTRGFRIPVERGNRQDIETYVRKELSSLNCTERTSIENQIITKARGIFQWAVLVCFNAVDLDSRGETAKMIESTISDIPENLDRLYEDLLHKNLDDRERMLRLFQWICFSEEPLNLLQLRWILILSPAMKETSINDCINGPQYRTSPEQLCKAIRHLSKGLIEFSINSDNCSAKSDFRTKHIITMKGFPGIKPVGRFDSIAFRPDRHVEIEPQWLIKAFLVHQSVKDYLCQKGLLKLQKLEPNQNSSGQAHSSIARSCLSHIFLQPQESVDNSISTYLEKWTFHSFEHHVALAESEGMDQFPILQDFCSPWHRFKYSRFHECLVQHDERLQKFCDDMRKSALRPTKDPLESIDLSGAHPIFGLPFLLARYGITSALRSLVEYNDSRCAQVAGLSGRSEAVAQMFSKIPWTELESEELPFLRLLPNGVVDLGQKVRVVKWTPLHIAASRGRVGLVKCLLKCPTVNPNEQCNQGLTALHYAADRSHDGVIKMLLNSDGVDPNIKSASGECAIIKWNGNMSEERFRTTVESWLLCPRADPNIRDQNGRSPLFYFLHKSFIAKTLRVPKIVGRIDPNVQDSNGETLLHRAVEEGNFDAVCALLDIEGIKKDLRDKWGDPPIFRIFFVTIWNSITLDHCAIKTLMSIFGPLIRGRGGQTLLHRAVENKSLETVMMLLEDGRISPDEKDDRGETVVATAESTLEEAYYEHVPAEGPRSVKDYASAFERYNSGDYSVSYDEWRKYMKVGSPEMEIRGRKYILIAKRILDMLEEDSPSGLEV